MRVKKEYLAIFARLTLMPSSLALPVVLELNGFPFELNAAIYLSIFLSILFRFGFDRRYFAYVRRRGFPLIIILTSIFLSSAIVSLFNRNIYYFPLGLFIASCLMISIYFRSRDRFVISSIFDVPGVVMIISVLSFTGTFGLTTLSALLSSFCVAWIILNTKVQISFTKKSILRTFSLMSALNSSSGFLLQSIVNYSLSFSTISEQAAYDIRLSERLAGMVIVISNASYVLVQRLAMSKAGRVFLQSFGKISFAFGIMIFFSMVIIDLSLSFIPHGGYFIYFGLVYMLVLFFPPMGHAGDQLGFQRKIFASNLIFIFATTLVCIFFGAAIGFVVYILSISAERALVYYSAKSKGLI